MINIRTRSIRSSEREIFAMVLFFCLIPLPGKTFMRDERDRVISAAVIEQFRRECSHKAGIDQSKIVELQNAFDRVRKDKSSEAQGALGCYQERMSQLTGIHQLYKDLCEDVGNQRSRDEAEQLRVLLMTQRYKRGITPFHDLLNDCLVERAQDKFIVRTGRFRTEGATLLKELDKLNIKKPFEEDRVIYR